jgi:hypothetical protein
MKKEEKNYCIYLHAVGKKETTGWDGFDESVTHFRTSAKVGTIAFAKAQMDAVDECWQQQQRWWLDYRLGKLSVEVGREPVSVMSPAWEYHKGRTFAVWEEVTV